MVKNEKGGSKHKKMGRKFTSNNTVNRKVRYAKEEGEMYACVQKLLGNGMCHVLCADGKQRLCVIRNKFRGRGKRGNTVIIGTLILSGLRTWESQSAGKIEKCDLLEVYDDREYEELKNNVAMDWSIFKHIGQVMSENKINDDDMDMFEIADNEIDETLESEIMNEIQSGNDNIIGIDSDDEVINIDDI